METLIVVMIVGIVLLLSARAFYRTFTGKNDDCGCACNGSCHQYDNCRKSTEAKPQSAIISNNLEK